MKVDEIRPAPPVAGRAKAKEPPPTPPTTRLIPQRPARVWSLLVAPRDWSEDDQY